MLVVEAIFDLCTSLTAYGHEFKQSFLFAWLVDRFGVEGTPALSKQQSGDATIGVRLFGSQGTRSVDFTYA